MKSNDKKTLKKMNIMVHAFGEIVKICSYVDLEDLPFPDVEVLERYNKIVEILKETDSKLLGV